MSTPDGPDFAPVPCVLVLSAARRVVLRHARPEDAAELNEYTDHFTRGVLYACEAESGLALDYDDISGEPVRVQTCAGLAPLLLPRHGILAKYPSFPRSLQ